MRPLHLLITAAALGALTGRGAWAQRSGVLIGVVAPSAENPYANGANIETARYQTLWIVRDRHRPLRAVLPDLLIPRRTGFWRLGLVSTCVYDPAVRNQRTEDVRWRAPLDSVVRIDPNPECPPIDTTATSTSSDTTADRRAAVDTAAETACGYTTLRLGFVMPEFVGVWSTSGQSEECEPRGFRWYDRASVHRLDADDDVSLDSVVGPRARQAYANAITGKGRTDEGFDCPELSREDYSPHWLLHWTLERNAGRWVPIAFYQPWLSAACQFKGAITVALPSALRGASMRQSRWAAIRSRVPDAVDAATSPTDDLVAAVTADSLLVFEFDGKTLGRRLLSRPVASNGLGGPIVMIEWAVGPHVARWEEAVLRAVAIGPGVRLVEATR
jgi:hypothetical protein